MKRQQKVGAWLWDTEFSHRRPRRGICYSPPGLAWCFHPSHTYEQNTELSEDLYLRFYLVLKKKGESLKAWFLCIRIAMWKHLFAMQNVTFSFFSRLTSLCSAPTSRIWRCGLIMENTHHLHGDSLYQALANEAERETWHHCLHLYVAGQLSARNQGCEIWTFVIFL